MNTKNVFVQTSQSALKFAKRSLAGVAVVLTLQSGIALAASSWSPTVLVNTEAFQTIDDRDASSDVYIQFGQTLGKTLTYERALGIFRFNDDLWISGTLSGSYVHAERGLSSSGNLVIETAEDSEYIRLQDSTNNDGVGIRTGSGTPNGVISAELGSLYIDHFTGKIYKNNNGATQWVELTSGSGTLHMAEMTRASAQSIDTTTVTKILFDTEVYDVGGIADSVTNDRFDIAKPGKYYISANWGLNATLDDTEEIYVAIYKNGVAMRNSRFQASGTNKYNTAQVSGILDLVPGDQITMYVYHDEGASVNTETTQYNMPRMSVIQLQDQTAASFWTGSGANIYNNNSGNVGIGITDDAETKLEVVGIMSGTTVYANQSFSGAGLSDCDNATTSKLLWDATTGRFSCGTDQTGGTSGLVDHYVNVAGDTMTGALTITPTGGFGATALTVNGESSFGSGMTLSGHLVPYYNNRFDLGSSTNRWRDLYLSGSSLHIGSSTLEGKIGYKETDTEGMQFFGTGGAVTPVLFISSGGLVGINNGAPSQVLHMKTIAQDAAIRMDIAGEDGAAESLSAGPSNPGTLASDIGNAGLFSWNTPSNAGASDDSYTTSSTALGMYSEWLKATNFGFSIPNDATIDGIIVEIEKKSDVSDTVDEDVQLVKAGTPSGTDKGDGITTWPLSDAYSTYGTSSDLWGQSWTPAEINASNFGVVLSQNSTTSGGGTASVDHIRITVHYTTASPGGEGKTWTIGTDYSDESKFKFSQSSSLGTLDRMTLTTTGSLGIGTTTPGAKLAVSGAVIVNAGGSLGSAQPDTALEVIGTVSGSVLQATSSVKIGSATLQGKMTYTSNGYEGLNFFGTGGAVTPVLFLSSGGLVGINTATPTQLLHLNTTGNDAALRFQIGAEAGGTPGSDGPNSGGTFADDASIGTETWSDTGNAASSDNSYATVSTNGNTSHYLKATNFGFAIPAGATINGIIVEIERYCSMAAITDNAFRIIKGGTIGSTDRSSVSTWDTIDNDTYVTYGSSSDLWGETWTADDINASNFGMALSVSDASLDFASVDHIRITVHYTTGAGGPGRDWSQGVDYSDNSKFKFSQSSTLGSTDRVTITATGAVGIGTSTPESKLSVSGSVLVNPYGTLGSSRAEGALEVVGIMSGTTVYANQSFSGAGLSDCDNGTTSKLLWDSSTGRFSCGTDQSGGAGGLVDHYVNAGGDTMTGQLVIDSVNALSVSGALVFNDAGYDVDARFEGDTDQNLLFFDASADRIGIGTSTPETKLEVVGTISGSQLRAGNMTVSGAVVYTSGSTLQATAKGATGQLLVSRGTDAPEWKTPTSALVWFLDGVQAVGTDVTTTVTMPYGFTPTGVNLKAKNAPTGQSLIVDINENGSTIFATRPEIAASATSGGGSAVFSDTDLAAGAEITIDIDQIGSGAAGSGLTIQLNGTRKY